MEGKFDNTQYKEFFDQAPVGLYKTQQKDGLFIKINQYGANLLGYKNPEEVIGNVYSTNLYDPETRKKLLHSLKCGNKVTDFEIGLIRTDGDLAWVSVTAMNGDDFIIGSFTDITKRKNLEAEVEKYEALAYESLSGINEDVAHRLKEFDRLFSK